MGPTLSEERLISPRSGDEDVVDRAVRPRLLQDYIGQKAMREQMAIFIQAARSRREALDHVLIFGPPGWARPRSPISSPTRWV